MHSFFFLPYPVSREPLWLEEGLPTVVKVHNQLELRPSSLLRYRLEPERNEKV
jgi:hypothetical protein